MTRYVCTDIGHARDGTVHPVDVTAEVRLERDLMPRPLVYLATTESVIAGVSGLSPMDGDARRSAVVRILTGVDAPAAVPLVLASERGTLFHSPGLHELDDLRRTEPAIDRLVDERTGGVGDFLHVEELPPPPARTDAGTDLRTEDLTLERVTAIPQGVFDIRDLTERLLVADPAPRSLADAIRHAPRVDGAATLQGEPWRVVVTCPVAEGSPPVHHDVVFTGLGPIEAGVVEGMRATGYDALVEEGARTDLAPDRDLARTERRLSLLLVAEIGLALAVILLAWASGGLAAAARETPGWLAFAIALALVGVTFAGIALLAPRDPRGNVNDTFAVRGFYSSRVEMLQIASAISIGAFLLALAAGTLPPVLEMDRPHPAAHVTFTQDAGAALTATVELTTDGVASDEVVTVEIWEFRDAAAPGDRVGSVSATGSSDGTVSLRDTVALASDAAFMSVRVAIGDDAAPTCTPTSIGGAGCTVVSLPASLVGGRRPVVVSTIPATVTVTTTSPAPSVVPTPSAAASPTATVSPSATVSPTSPSPT
jgi:hypothetical protein